ncbi:MAG TPA: methyltransferase, partial [Solirubrobacteraceae bacterium]|nr:methyltransferase [Solirubrobacteraceae bacterium]
AYDHDRLQRYEQQLEQELARLGDEGALYRRSDAYLYNLTAFAMTETKLPYLRRLAAIVPSGALVLDYGCGIGSDGLCLLEAGYRVAFADYESPSLEYLRWRLRRRDLSAAGVYDLDTAAPPDGFDAAYAFDVIEHVDQPFEFLAELERRAALVIVNLLEPAARETALHRRLPIAELLRHCSTRGPLFYARYHRRSHLVCYAPGRRGTRRARAALAWALLRLK